MIYSITVSLEVMIKGDGFLLVPRVCSDPMFGFMCVSLFYLQLGSLRLFFTIEPHNDEVRHILFIYTVLLVTLNHRTSEGDFGKAWV